MSDKLLELATRKTTVGTRFLMTKLLFQKWQCVEDASGKLKLHKCKGMANLAAASNGKGPSNILPKYYNRNSEDCNCEENEYKLSPLRQRKKLFSKKSKQIHCIFSLCLRKLLFVNSHSCLDCHRHLIGLAYFLCISTMKQHVSYWTVRFENISL